MSAIVTTILSQGKELDVSRRVLSIEVDKDLNRVPSARLRLSDGDVASAKFALSDDALFAPGKEIEIKLGYAGDGGLADE